MGDQVTAYDPATGTSSTQTVQHVWVNHDHDLLDVTLHEDGTATQAAAAPDKAQEVATKAHGSQAPPSPSDETIHTAEQHPWLTTDRGWVKAGDLHAGEHVVELGGRTATITALAVKPGEATYYNLTVSNLHTYAVGASRAVVHNCRSAGLQLVDELRASNSIPGTVNIAYADSNIAGVIEHVHAASGTTNPAGFLRAPQDVDRLLTRALDHSVPSFRRYDSEIKILEHYAGQLRNTPNAIGTITLFTERPPCADLCSSAIEDGSPHVCGDDALHALNAHLPHRFTPTCVGTTLD